MMRLKFAFWLMFFPFLICRSLAQDMEKQPSGLHFALQVSTGFYTMTGKDYWGEPLENKSTFTYGSGINVNIPLSSDLYFQPGIQVTGKGARQNIILDNITKKIRLTYLEVPLNILYRPQAGNGHLLMGAGAYIATGIAGKETTESENISTELKVKYLTDASEQPTTFVYYKSFDSGINLFFGYEFYHGMYLQVNVQKGLVEVNSDYGLPNDRTSKKNFGFGISAGYRF